MNIFQEELDDAKRYLAETQKDLAVLEALPVGRVVNGLSREEAIRQTKENMEVFQAVIDRYDPTKKN